MNTLNRPPFPQRDLNVWARQLYEYLSSQSPVKGTVDPAATLLAHITSDQTPRAETSGVMLYDPVADAIVVSKNGVWVPLLDNDTPLDLAGDVIGAINSNELVVVNDDAGAHGSASVVPTFTIDAKGRVLDVSPQTISIPATAINDSTAAGRALLTAANAAAQTALLNEFTSSLKGLVPASGGEANEVLHADGQFKPVKFFAKLAAGYTLANTTAAQKLFNFTPDGAITLDTGVYVMELVFTINSMSGTSGNGTFSLAGTATLANPRINIVAADTSTFPASADVMSASTTSAVLAVSRTGTGLAARVICTFDVTSPGTVIPSIALATAIATAQVLPSGFVTVERMADEGVNVVGPWS